MNEVEEIKRRIDIIDLISSYLTLKKAGANYRAVCPFHNEKTPSLMVSPEKQIFKCFGCNEGGDIFEFIMKMENLEFREALEMLAQRAGVKLQARGPLSPEEKPDKKSKLFRINALSAQVFHKILTTHPAGKDALEYLRKRKLSDQTIKDFLIGYAPSQKILASFLTKHGFTNQEIQNAGGPDRFYKRIIFPIRDVMGNVLGFTGRVLDPQVQPKYLNTPETIIFHKGRILFNLEKARGEIKLQKAVVVVEGQMDVISSYQAGVKNVVATSGTALTEEHLQILFRYTPNIIFAFDSDTAGLTTAKKAYEMAIAEGFNVRMVDLNSPDGEFKDPGEMISEGGPELWNKAVLTAKPVIEWYFDLAFEKGAGGRAQGAELTSVEKKEIAKEILPVIKKIPNSIEQADYVEKLAAKLRIPDNIIFEALSKAPQSEVKKLPRMVEKKLSLEEILVGFLINNPKEIKSVDGQISPEDFTIEKFKNVYIDILNWYNKGESGNLIKYLSSKKAQDSKEIELLSLEVEQKFSDKNIIKDLVSRIKSNRKEKIKDFYAKEISLAEQSGDREKLKRLIKEFQDAISK